MMMFEVFGIECEDLKTLSQEELELLYWETVEMEEELSEEIMSEELLRRV